MLKHVNLLEDDGLEALDLFLTRLLGKCSLFWRGNTNEVVEELVSTLRQRGSGATTFAHVEIPESRSDSSTDQCARDLTGYGNGPRVCSPAGAEDNDKSHGGNEMEFSFVDFLNAPLQDQQLIVPGFTEIGSSSAPSRGSSASTPPADLAAVLDHDGATGQEVAMTMRESAVPSPFTKTPPPLRDAFDSIVGVGSVSWNVGWNVGSVMDRFFAANFDTAEACVWPWPGEELTAIQTVGQLPI
ncbi:hypothetical protein AYL99_11006 [Fonsecaea erecta]|uniref:Uncharacterized protein n=1 Tax=Fonsecaea erecta TaxID=1367422 RepID=A0A178Z491_9EURO|nr:hypothetical protein AYL99_11006 [Fonsecaea erecta]OAP54558.1 hypothetical protein AYL99_11006 [Fonsecaea erecta]